MSKQKIFQEINLIGSTLFLILTPSQAGPLQEAVKKLEQSQAQIYEALKEKRESGQGNRKDPQQQASLTSEDTIEEIKQEHLSDVFKRINDARDEELKDAHQASKNFIGNPLSPSQRKGKLPVPKIQSKDGKSEKNTNSTAKGRTKNSPTVAVPPIMEPETVPSELNFKESAHPKTALELTPSEIPNGANSGGEKPILDPESIPKELQFHK